MFRLSFPKKQLCGTIQLDGSKSISNRALIVFALMGIQNEPYLSGLSTSSDTQRLLQLLDNQSNVFDAGDAGTTYRFLTALLATRAGEQILTGSTRMKERPIGELVAALRGIGAKIDYLEKEGFPPLRIGSPEDLGQNTHEIRIEADTSSQFVSALMLIAPYLPHGLVLQPEGTLVSKPYLKMTQALMQYFGAQVIWEDEKIVIPPSQYRPQPLHIEADWSAAAFWFSMVALAPAAEISLQGLHAESWQGDAAVMKMMKKVGVLAHFQGATCRLQKMDTPRPPVFEQDFLDTPDLVQALAVACAGLGVKGVFSGLDNLHLKETNRVAALKTELAKTGVTFARLPKHFSKKHPEKTFYLLDGQCNLAENPTFSSHGDHRMAMAFAPLALLADVSIENPEVVSKSYPQFWEHLQAVGFHINY